MADKTTYTLKDEDGDKFDATFIRNHCKCSTNCCYDDELEIYDGDDTPYRMSIPTLMTTYIEGVFESVRKLQAENEELKRLITNFQRTKTTGDMHSLFEYANKLEDKQ
jgi:hypothetical protein